MSCTYRRPILDYNREAYAIAMAAWGGATSLILDAGCGVGESSIHLARAFPDHFVIGVDQSADRIGRDKHGIVPVMPDNLVFVRADVVDFWRLAAADGLRLARHYLLYPNPWPKAHHLMRRWHGHPVFPVLRELGGVIECRSNWHIYALEFAHASTRLFGFEVSSSTIHPASPLTPFERKYQRSGHALFGVHIDSATHK